MSEKYSQEYLVDKLSDQALLKKVERYILAGRSVVESDLIRELTNYVETKSGLKTKQKNLDSTRVQHINAKRALQKKLTSVNSKRKKEARKAFREFENARLKERALEYGTTVEKYKKAIRRGKLPPRSEAIPNKKTPDFKKPGDVSSIPLDEYSNKSAEGSTEEVDLAKKYDNYVPTTHAEDFEFNVLNSEELRELINDSSTDDLVELWERRIERINTLQDACELLAEIRYRQGIDEIKNDPRTFIKTPQIQELTEYLEDESFENSDMDGDQAEARKEKKIGNVLQTIREGQAGFRSSLMNYYGTTCMVTGEITTEVIEAAHIEPYNGTHTNGIENGMLLRTDIHKLFDKNLLAINPDDLTIHISKKLDGSTYSLLEGTNLKLSKKPRFKENVFSHRWALFHSD